MCLHSIPRFWVVHYNTKVWYQVFVSCLLGYMLALYSKKIFPSVLDTISSINLKQPDKGAVIEQIICTDATEWSLSGTISDNIGKPAMAEGLHN